MFFRTKFNQPDNFQELLQVTGYMSTNIPNFTNYVRDMLTFW